MSNEVTNMMLNDSKDLLDSIEITTIAAECVKLKQKEDEIASLEEFIRSASRNSFQPDNIYGILGFRVVLAPKVDVEDSIRIP